MVQLLTANRKRAKTELHTCDVVTDGAQWIKWLTRCIFDLKFSGLGLVLILLPWTRRFFPHSTSSLMSMKFYWGACCE